jgi:hypothetical protein
MQSRLTVVLPGLLAGLLSVCLTASAQSLPGPTTVNVQGRLTASNGSAVADGPHTITVSLWDAATGGAQKFTQTLANVPVAAGLFSAQITTLTPDTVNGAMWVQFQVDADAAMAPRLPLAAVASALKANTVPDGAITAAKIAAGVIPTTLPPSGAAGGSLAGTYPNPSIVADAVTNAGLKSDAASLLKVSGGAMTSSGGSVGVGTITPGSKLDVAGTAQMTGFKLSTGAAANKVLASDAAGVGTWSDVTSLLANGSITNPMIQSVDWSKVTGAPLGGWTLNGNAGTTADNFLGTTNDFTTAGSKPLVLKVNGQRAFQMEYGVGGVTQGMNMLGGSSANTISSGVAGATISGGGGKLVSNVTIDYINQVTANFGTVGGGGNNVAASYAVVGGGDGNTANGSRSAIAGGGNNIAGGTYGSVAGGSQNNAGGDNASVGGGLVNSAGGENSTVGGGNRNKANVVGATVAGGNFNTAGGSYSVVAGGQLGNAMGAFSTVPGGNNNTAGGTYSLAAGQQAQANHDGAFVWNDSTNAAFASTANDQFLVHANGGVGINTNAPAGFALNVNGTASVTSLTQTSDVRFKTNIASFPGALNTVLGLRGVTFDWDRAGWPARNFPTGPQVGFIAQEVETVLPELVHTDSNGYKSVAYANIVPVLVEAMKTLKQDNDATKRENADLKARLDALEQAVQQMTTRAK